MMHVLIAALTLSQILSPSFAMHTAMSAASSYAHSCKADAVGHVCGKRWMTRAFDKVLGRTELVSVPLKTSTSPEACRQSCVGFEATRFKSSKQDFLRKLKAVASAVGPAGYAEDWQEVEDDVESSFCCEFNNGQCSLTYSPAQPVEIAKEGGARSFLKQGASKGANVKAESVVAWECSVQLNKDEDFEEPQILTWSDVESDEE